MLHPEAQIGFASSHGLSIPLSQRLTRIELVHGFFYALGDDGLGGLGGAVDGGSDGGQVFVGGLS